MITTQAYALTVTLIYKKNKYNYVNISEHLSFSAENVKMNNNLNKFTEI